MHHVTRRLSPSLIVAICALFVALAGTAAAAVIVDSPDQIKDKVVTEPKLADGAIGTRALADKGVRLADLAQPTIATGVSAGVSPGGHPFLFPESTDAVQVEGPASDEENNGSYTVRFRIPVRACVWSVTQAAITWSGGASTLFTVRPSQFDTHEVFVFARRLVQGGVTRAAPASFNLVGRC